MHEALRQEDSAGMPVPTIKVLAGLRMHRPERITLREVTWGAPDDPLFDMGLLDLARPADAPPAKRAHAHAVRLWITCSHKPALS